mgnify:CR=1 FL=1
MIAANSTLKLDIKNSNSLLNEMTEHFIGKIKTIQTNKEAHKSASNYKHQQRQNNKTLKQHKNTAQPQKNISLRRYLRKLLDRKQSREKT